MTKMPLHLSDTSVSVMQLAGWLVVISTFIVLPFKAAAQAGCFPNDTQVAFFEDSDFEGRCSVRSLGQFSSSSAMGIGNDRLSSIRVGKDVQVRICQHTRFRGECTLVSQDIARLGGGPTGNDEISSAVVQPLGTAERCFPGNGQIALFEDADFRGICIIHGTGSYENPEEMDFRNDTLSSLRVGPGVKVRLCQHDGFSGNCQDFQSDVSSLNGSVVGNDQVSSMQIVAASQPLRCGPAAQGIGVFEDKNFGGDCAVVELGNYARPDEFPAPLRNDSTSSLIVGTGIRALLCEHDFYGGRCTAFPNPRSGTRVEDIGRFPIGNDRVSSMRIVRTESDLNCSVQPDKISVFADTQFSGACLPLGIGRYANESRMEFKEDTISSVRVGDNVQALLCRNRNFGGDCERFGSSSSNLFGSRIGNDTVSSIIVRASDDFPCQPARGQVGLFSHSDFVEPCVLESAGSFPNGRLNDEISSFLLGEDTELELCSDRDFKGLCHTFSMSVPDMRGQPVGNDRASSYRIQIVP